MDYVEALRVQERIRTYGWRAEIYREEEAAPRWYILAGDPVTPKWVLRTARAAAKLLYCMREIGYGQQSA